MFKEQEEARQRVSEYLKARAARRAQARITEALSGYGETVESHLMTNKENREETRRWKQQ